MFFTGCRVSAQELYRLGIVEACVPREQLMDEAMKIAREIASKSPLAMRYAKGDANTVEELSLREALLAFIEKRKPQFKGMRRALRDPEQSFPRADIIGAWFEPKSGSRPGLELSLSGSPFLAVFGREDKIRCRID